MLLNLFNAKTSTYKLDITFHTFLSYNHINKHTFVWLFLLIIFLIIYGTFVWYYKYYSDQRTECRKIYFYAYMLCIILAYKSKYISFVVYKVICSAVSLWWFNMMLMKLIGRRSTMTTANYRTRRLSLQQTLFLKVFHRYNKSNTKKNILMHTYTNWIIILNRIIGYPISPFLLYVLYINTT